MVSLMDFEKLLRRAKAGSQDAIGELLAMYNPLLMKASIVDNCFDEDLYQELTIVLLRCIELFRI